MGLIVKKLSDYISAIEDNALYDCISRGEHKKYATPLRSAILRESQPERYSELLQDYYNQVEVGLTDLQNKHFIAFSQHHGIPTNLLDFSKSPLVSLYFATECCEDSGYVYFIKKSKLVDAGKLIISKPYGWGLMDDLLNFDGNTLQLMAQQLSHAFLNNAQDMVDFFIKYMEDFISNYNQFYGKIEDHRIQTIKIELDALQNNRCIDDRGQPLISKSSLSTFKDVLYNALNGKKTFPYNTFKNYDSSKPITGSAQILTVWPSIQHVLLLTKCEATIRFDDFGFPTGETEIEMPFYFSYYPPMIDSRVQNQASIFVFQPFVRDDHVNGKEQVRYWQRIKPDFEIEIENPKAIQEELDAIGINRKYIYCDYDNTAQYIVNHFFGKR